MTDLSWRIDEPDPADAVSAGPQPALVSLHFLVTALRRRWRVWVGAALIGLMLGVAWTFVVPAPHTGTVTLLLAHDPNVDPDQAMATDISMLRTRAVANQTVQKLGLETTPEGFQREVDVTQVSSTVLTLDVVAPHDRAAVLRARTLARTFLGFRASEIQKQSDALIRGYNKRIEALQRQAERLTQRYDALSQGGPASRNQATDVLTQRSETNSEISGLQQTVQDTVLQYGSIIAASHVLDPASAVPHSAKMRTALAMGSGLVGGTAVGMGIVLFLAITSDRLRRRDELAVALGIPVRFSVGDLGRRKLGQWLRRRPSPARNLQVLVHGLESAVHPRKGRAARVALATVDSPLDAERVVATLAARLGARGLNVFVVDLSEAGRLARSVSKALAKEGRTGPATSVPVVYHPDGVPSLSRGPIGATPDVTTDLPENDPWRAVWDTADVILTLAEVEPALGVEHLRSWTDEVVLLVTAGRSSAERLRTTAELFRTSEVPLTFAMMTGADTTDQSLGLPDSFDASRPETRRSS